jgi:hypothetical protein
MKFTNIATIFALVAATAYAANKDGKGTDADSAPVVTDGADKTKDTKAPEAPAKTEDEIAAEKLAAEKLAAQEASDAKLATERANLKKLISENSDKTEENFIKALVAGGIEPAVAKASFAHINAEDDKHLETLIPAPVIETKAETKSWYKNPLYIGAGVVVLGALAGGAYMLVRKSSDETDL